MTGLQWVQRGYQCKVLDYFMGRCRYNGRAKGYSIPSFSVYLELEVLSPQFLQCLKQPLPPEKETRPLHIILAMATHPVPLVNA